jgi:acyl-CoA reductase-like NAD-dependent aldehyde dehydrogenase
MRAKDDAHAVELKHSQFGLGSGVFTGNIKREKKLALQLKQEVAL